jgi:hypothetical protein
MPATRRSIDYLPLEDVRRASHNPKGHDTARIRHSISEHGFVEPIVMDERTGRLVAGHGRLDDLIARRAAAGKTGKAKGGPPDGILLEGSTWLVPVIRGWASRDDAHAEAYLLASNQLTIAGGWDPAGLADSLQRLTVLDPALLRLAGFTDSYLDDLLDRLAGEPGTPLPGGNPHAAPPKPDTAVLSRPGDLYQLGPHRLIVGDASDPAVLTRLMDGGRAQLLWTDPPYGVDYVGKTSKRLTIIGDRAAAAVRLFAAILDSIETAHALSPGAAFYVAHPDGPLSWQFRALLCTPPYRYRQGLIWVKDSMVLGRTDYHYRHETVVAGNYGILELLDQIEDEQLRARVIELFDTTRPEHPSHDAFAYGYLSGGGQRGRGPGGSGWHGTHAETTVLHVPRPKASTLHPTMKPVDLIARHITNSTRRGATVLDTSAGSGPVLIAAQQLGRVARMVELDPGYADVICARWQHITGTPPLIGGEPRTFPPLPDEAA